MRTAQRVAFITCLATLVLIAVGVIVRATGSGLGCPDWPLCHGGVVPPNHHHAWIEFSHRFVASIVGLLVIATAILAWKFYRHSPMTVWAAIITVPLVGFQGILGAITVVRDLPAEIVATHLVTAMLILSFEIFVFLTMYFEDPERRARLNVPREPARRVGGVAVVALVWLVALMWIGGYMAESGAATACEGWPACNGSILPASDHQEITHMAHRYLAGAFVFLVVPFVVMAWRRRNEVPFAAPIAVTVLVLYVTQVMVGALNVWYTFPEPLTVSHTVIASGVWATLSAAAVIGFYAPARVRSSRSIPAGVPA